MHLSQVTHLAGGAGKTSRSKDLGQATAREHNWSVFFEGTLFGLG